MTTDDAHLLIAFDSALATAIEELTIASDLGKLLGHQNDACNLALVAFIVVTTRRQYVEQVALAKASQATAEPPPF